MTFAPPDQVTTPEPKARDLKQENSDFTAEGAPPPGMVGTTPPETPGAQVPTAPDGDTRGRAPGGPALEDQPRTPSAKRPPPGASGCAAFRSGDS